MKITRIVVFPIPTTDLWVAGQVMSDGTWQHIITGSRFTTKSIAAIAARDADCPVVTYPQEN